jgi:hypothetical protein
MHHADTCWKYYAAVGGVLGRVSPGGHGASCARHAGARIGGNTQTRTLTEIDSGRRGADDAFGRLIGHPPRERLEAASASAAFLFWRRTRKRLLKSLTQASEEQTMRVGCPAGHLVSSNLEAACLGRPLF